MAEHTYEELKHMTVAELREIAAELDHPAVQGYTQLNKAHLIPAICEALGIETHAHHEVVGIDKAKIKGKIQELKKKRDAILAQETDDKRARRQELKPVLREIHHLKRRIHKATV